MTAATSDVDARGLRRRCRDGHRIAWIRRGRFREDYRGLCTDGHWWEQTTGRALRGSRAPQDGSIELTVRYPRPERPDWHGGVSGLTPSFGWATRFLCGLGHTSHINQEFAYDWRADVEAVRAVIAETPFGAKGVDSRERLADVMRLLVERFGWRFEDGRVDCPRCVAERARFAAERATIDREEGAGQVVATAGAAAESSASAEPLGAP